MTINNSRIIEIEEYIRQNYPIPPVIKISSLIDFPFDKKEEINNIKIYHSYFFINFKNGFQDYFKKILFEVTFSKIANKAIAIFQLIYATLSFAGLILFFGGYYPLILLNNYVFYDALPTLFNLIPNQEKTTTSRQIYLQHKLYLIRIISAPILISIFLIFFSKLGLIYHIAISFYALGIIIELIIQYKIKKTIIQLIHNSEYLLCYFLYNDQISIANKSTLYFSKE